MQEIPDQDGCRRPCIRRADAGPGRAEKNPAIGAGLPDAQASFGLAGRNVGRTRAFFPLSNFELDRLTLTERGVTRRFDLRMVDKQVLAAVRRADKAKTLTFVEPFHCSFCHVFFS